MSRSFPQTFAVFAMITGLLVPALGQQRLATGEQKSMPTRWIDQATGHQVQRLTPLYGSNASFYFHNNPFVPGRKKEGAQMVYYHTDPGGQRQLYTVDLQTRKTRQLTHQRSSMSGEVVAPKRREVFYQIKDSVFATHVDTRKTRLVFVFPADFKASITTLNADETQLAGAWSTDAEKEIFRQYPTKHEYFTRIYEARLPRTLFTIDVDKGQLTKLFTDSAWLNHVQFSPSEPRTLMFCHEGPWHKVDRIWTINTQTKAVQLVHKRTMNMEIAGHEFFGPDGRTIWFDNQLPRGATFYLTGTELQTGQQKKYQLDRNEWSIHFTASPDQTLFAGDGGNPTQVAKAPDGQWIYLFRPTGEKFQAEKLVNMRHHDYKLEPNVHFSPDGKWIIFRANFEGSTQVYAVEIAKAS